MASAWQQSYDRYASGYASELVPTLVGAVERVVELAEARSGVRLLDVATGTGTIARAAAARGASVVAIDASAGMLEVARRLSPELDLCLGDACALPFGDGEFDVVTCGLSISHFADREKALGEVLRVLRQPGKLVASTWAGGTSSPTRGVAEVLDRYAAAVDSLDEETWSAGRQGTDVLRKAGFTSVSVQTESFRGEFADAEDALAWVTAWPLPAERLARLDPGRRERFFSDARAALAATSLSWSFVFNFYVAHQPGTQRTGSSRGSPPSHL
jgi:SAM-dependent methyltransferase